MADLFSLKGKVALVTGASKEMGQEVAHALAEYGADVAVTARTAAQLEATAARVRQTGRKALVIPADLTDIPKLPSIVSRTVDALGGLDILVNVAGGGDYSNYGWALRMTEEMWDNMFLLNLKAPMFLCQAAANVMKDHGGGSIVNLGSGCNKLAFPSLVAYTASKGGIEMFTKEAAVELGRYGIRVNCIAPGSIESERTRTEDPDYAGTWSRLTPLGRVGTAADIAPTVVFLASKGASFISGQTIWIDGALFTQAQWPYKK